MNRSDSPKKQPKPFGVNGQRGAILPTTPAGDNSASYEQGFPPITMILKSAGGLPPKGQDMNQILYELSALGRWSSTGALNTFDSEFASEISGYPSGAMLISDDGERIFINTTEGNLSDPNNNGVGWKDALSYLGLGDGSGRLINCQVFKSSGTYTPTKGTRFIIVEIVGGGGAGGGCQVGYPNNAACGGGGMSGEYVKARVDNPTVTTVTIGYGGTGASASVGAPGGATSFGNTIIAKGGLGGNVLAEGTAPGVVGPYGAYTEPGFTGANIIGSGSGYSSPGVRFSGSLAIGGPGGDSILGAGAGSQAIVGEGINANGHGGGGGGACVYGGATQQRAGGSGMAGIAIIWEYA
ncbi:hypothetical protein FEL34_08685 [Escherichia coli]|nr:hypothetical protein [Escherichia coli]